MLWRQKGWATGFRAEFVQRLRQHPQLASRCIDVLYGLKSEPGGYSRVRPSLDWISHRLLLAPRVLRLCEAPSALQNDV